MEVHPKHKVSRSEGNDLADVNLIINEPDISYQPHRYTSLVEPQRDSGERTIEGLILDEDIAK
jgi:hypothetical protein